MPEKTSETIINELYSKVSNVIVPTDPEQSLPPVEFVTLMLPGITVHAQDFDPDTSKGRDNLYRTMDRLPAVNKHYLDSGRSCSGMYQKVLSAQTSDDDPERAAAMEEEFQQAQDYLRTRAYSDYKNYRDEYDDAHDDYLCAMNDPDLSDEERTKRMRRAKRAMENAYDDWVSLGSKQKVEEALAVCARYLAYTPKKVFKEAGETFNNAKDPDTGLYPVVCTPSEWATAPDKLSWTQVVIKQDSSESRLHEDVKKIDSDFSASLSAGLWHADASSGYHDEVEKINKSSSVDKLGISFEIARININRDWFTSSLLTYEDTTIPGEKKGSLCAGSLTEAAKCTFPFLPTAFVVARNINIYNEFSSAEEDFLQEAQSWSASAKVGYGPFSVSNQTSSSHDLTTQEKREFGTAVKMTMGEGMQIIGFLNTILTPAFPGKDSGRAAIRQLTAFGDFLLNSGR